jgi:2-dehydropantoate 2-reductase
MEKQEVRVVVVGAGAIGGVTAGLLAGAGHDVHIVCRHADWAEKIGARGLHVFGCRGEARMKLPAVASAADLEGSYDIALMATKAPDLPDAARALLPHLAPDSAVVSLQNGFCEQALAEVVGGDRTVGCVVGWGATLHAPGEVEMTSTGEFVIGTLGGSPHPRLGALQTMLSTIVPTTVSENMIGHLYSKLIINSCITTLGVLCGQTLGEMLRMRRAREIFIRIIEEAVAVAQACGIRIEPYAGKLDYTRFIRGRGLAADLRRHGFIRLMGFKYRRLKSSSLQSVRRGRKSEIDYLNGFIAEKGRRHAVPTPLNEALVRMVHEIEGGEREITPENFGALPYQP